MSESRVLFLLCSHKRANLTDFLIYRRLFRWVTTKNFDAVEYDPVAPNDSFVGMLRNVQAGALSRNELFHELCRFAGIYCQYISGYSKGAGYRPGMSLKQGALFRNTWLVVFAAGGWRFVNCNWAARYVTSAWNSISNDRKFCLALYSSLLSIC